MKIKDISNRDIANLKNCDQEPIHIPGTIQPHGFLVAADRETLRVIFCSSNIEGYTGVSYENILGNEISAFVDPGHISNINEPSQSSSLIEARRVQFNDCEFDGTFHISKRFIILECEPPLGTLQTIDPGFDLSKKFLGYMENSFTLKQLCTHIARGIREVTDYDRVMIYQFDKDYNGEVIAEDKREDLESFLNLHYPHTDIPVQARELYLRNQLRVIADVNYEPVPILTNAAFNNTDLDLSYSMLRSVSPIHIEYLKNMGVGATMTISLIHNGKLWGLVACHHYSSKTISHEARLAAKLHGHFITSQIEMRRRNEEFETARQNSFSADHLNSMKYELRRSSIDLFVQNPEALKVCNASGISILHNGVIYKKGNTPNDEDIMKLATYLSVTSGNTQFYTHSLKNLMPELKSVYQKTPGLIYYSLDNNNTNCVIWYREETITEVNWAGDPARSIEKDKNGLSPRKSFELWKEVVKNESRPWLESEVQSSFSVGNVLGRLLNSIVLAEEEEKQRKLMEDLRETNAELENVNWISTHDLQEPLRKIQLMASLILSGSKENTVETVHKNIGKINSSAQRMHILIRDLAKYAKLQNVSDSLEPIDINNLLQEVISEQEESLNETNAVIEINNLPVISGVPFLLKQLFTNLILNSIKFRDPQRRLHITIDGSLGAKDGKQGHSDVYKITYKDNGIGFEKKYNESIFNIFTRLHAEKEFSGSGIGLALCRKIMRSHKGSITAEGSPGNGVTFTLTLPRLKMQ